MKKEYAKHDEEFKKMIVNLCETNKDKTMSDIAREYGITRTSITQWRKKYGTITTSTGITTNNDEILKLQKKNHELEIENEILKKAVAIFSKKQMIRLSLLMTINIYMMLELYVNVQVYITQYIITIVIIKPIVIKQLIKNLMLKLRKYMINLKVDMAHLKLLKY